MAELPFYHYFVPLGHSDPDRLRNAMCDMPNLTGCEAAVSVEVGRLFFLTLTGLKTLSGLTPQNVGGFGNLRHLTINHYKTNH